MIKRLPVVPPLTLRAPAPAATPRQRPAVFRCRARRRCLLPSARCGNAWQSRTLGEHVAVPAPVGTARRRPAKLNPRRTHVAVPAPVGTLRKRLAKSNPRRTHVAVPVPVRTPRRRPAPRPASPPLALAVPVPVRTPRQRPEKTKRGRARPYAKALPPRSGCKPEAAPDASPPSAAPMVAGNAPFCHRLPARCRRGSPALPAAHQCGIQGRRRQSPDDAQFLPPPPPAHAARMGAASAATNPDGNHGRAPAGRLSLRGSAVGWSGATTAPSRAGSAPLHSSSCRCSLLCQPPRVACLRIRRLRTRRCVGRPFTRRTCLLCLRQDGAPACAPDRPGGRPPQRRSG